MKISQVWWYNPVIPGLGNLRKEDQEFKANLGWTARHCLKKLKPPTKQKYLQTYTKSWMLIKLA